MSFAWFQLSAARARLLAFPPSPEQLPRRDALQNRRFPGTSAYEKKATGEERTETTENRRQKYVYTARSWQGAYFSLMYSVCTKIA